MRWLLCVCCRHLRYHCKTVVVVVELELETFGLL